MNDSNEMNAPNKMGASKRILYILVFVLFVVMLGYGIIIPILPFYIENMGAGGTELGLLVASYAVMRLICGPIWGSLSDRVGRKPILILGILGYAITMVWFGLATQLWMLIAATAPTTMAYISDSTPEKERGGGIGTILGPVLGGFMAGESLSTPFFIAAGLFILSLLLAWLFLPESLPAGDRTEPEKDARILDIRAWAQAVCSPLGILFVLTFINTCGLMIFANVFGLYALERFSFGPQEVGVMMMVLGLVSTITQGVLAGPITKHWCDEVAIKGGLLATALQVPALSALTSKRATIPQGIAMGLSNSFVSLERIFGPLLGGYIFDINIMLPYLGGSAIMGIGLVVSLITLKGKVTETPYPVPG